MINEEEINKEEVGASNLGLAFKPLFSSSCPVEYLGAICAR